MPATVLVDYSGDPQSLALQRRVVLALQQRHLTAGGHWSVTVDRGVVTLAGRVRSFHQRQLLHTLARHVAGVVRVIDRLEVPGDASPT